MEQDKKQKPELAEEQLKEVADVAGGIIPPFPEKPTTSTF